jgi:uncharacterized membrane protein YkoI
LIDVSELSGCRAQSAAMWLPARRAFIILGLGAACLLLPTPARANRDDGDAPHDHDRARIAVERGEARPLADILAQVRPELGGEVVGVAFRRKAGHWVYEFRVIAPAGQMTEISVDAATARVIERETH